MAAAAAEPLISVHWLKDRLDDDNIRILDASWHMPNQNRDPRAEYQKERIPGAQLFDVDAVADTESDLPHMLPSEAAFAAAADALGITNDSHVILYDRAGIFSAPRVWWTFKAFGHESVSVLDGGFPAWAAADLPIDRQPVPEDRLQAAGNAARSPPATCSYRAHLNEDLVRTAQQVKANIDSKQAAVADARPPGRFDGSSPEPRPGIPSGHIPGSVNVPFPLLLSTDGRYRPPEELQKVFEDAGVDLSKPVITSCGTGVTASVLALALQTLPQPPPAVSVYDGSWTEWGARSDLPKATS